MNATPAAWGGLRPRAFGVALADLAVDFSTPPPHGVSAVLAACVDADGDPWQWDVVRRVQALLAVTVTTRGARYTVSARCPREGCGADMDLPLDLREFAVDTLPGEFDCQPAAGPALRVRLPRGEDQRRWLASSLATGDPAPRMARDLVVAVDGRPVDDDFEPAPEWLPALESALEQADPFTALRLATRCPDCDHEVDVELDLEAHLLALLAAEQPRLLDDIHRLAHAYHWSESDIVALPPARRRAYLARLERDGLS